MFIWASLVMQIIFWENSIGPYANLVAIQAILIETVNTLLIGNVLGMVHSSNFVNKSTVHQFLIVFVFKLAIAVAVCREISTVLHFWTYNFQAIHFYILLAHGLYDS